MKENHHLSAALLFAAVLVSLCVVLVGAIFTETVPSAFYWGIPFGFIFGLLSWAYLNATWDPVNMQPRNGGPKILERRWVPLVVLLGIGSVRIMPYFIGEANTYLVGGCMGSWLFLTVGYLAVQLWNHH